MNSGTGGGSAALLVTTHYSLFTFHFSLFTFHFSLFTKKAGQVSHMASREVQTTSSTAGNANLMHSFEGVLDRIGRLVPDDDLY
jgi:hypothetical protein